MSRVTLKDLASHLSLSPSAVSLGLRDSPKIPAPTRERIRATATRFGYRPNALMSECASFRWQSAKVSAETVIAYIDRSRDAETARVHAANLRTRALVFGYKLELLRREEFPSSFKIQKLLRNRGITDIILGPIFEEALQVDLDWSKFICVQLLSGLFQLPLHNVVKDHFNGVVLAWQKAVAKGYQRIGVVLLEHPVRLMDDVLRVGAARACQLELFPELPVLPPLRHTKFDAELHDDFVGWVKTNKPDVIIGFSDTYYHFYRAAFGRKTAYISLHRSENNSLSGFPEDSEKCDQEGVNLLHFCRRTHQWGVPERRIDHVIEPIWFEGSSLPAKGAAN